MFRVIVVISCTIAAIAFAPRGPVSSSIMMAAKPAFSFSPKKAVPVAAPVPAPKKPAFTFFPIKKPASPLPAPVKKAAVLAPAPVKKVSASVPVKSAPAPAPVKKAVPAKPVTIVKKAVPIPAKKSVVKSTPAPVKSFSSSSFAYGIVGSDIEAPEFDPLQLSVGRSEETISWYRAAELKHARICMLAALGLFIQPVLHFTDPVFDSTLGYGALTKVYAERPEAVWQILIALAAIETSTLFKNGQGVAGDLGFDPLNLKKTLKLDDPSKFAQMQLRELKNGRLAMIGASGLLLQEAVSGTGVYGSF